MAGSDTWGGLFWTAVGLAAAWLGYGLDLGTAGDPGPGAVIFWAGIGLAGLSTATVASGLRGGGAPLAALWAGTRWGRVILVAAALALYAVALGPVGFLLATPVLLLVLLRAVDPVRWPAALAFAVAAPLAVWWVMERLLSVRLPAGLLAS